MFTALSQALGYFITVYIGQVDVQQDQVDIMLFRLGETKKKSIS